MRALAVNPSKKSLEVIDTGEPEIIAPSEVKLKMLEAGVCGTDKEICAFDYGTPPAGSEFLILGHESLGEIVEVGKSVTRVKKGDLVVPSVRRPCGHPDCTACAAGRQDFCYSGDFTERGIKGRHGYMTSLVVDDERFMNVVPRELRDVAILVEPLTIAEKALLQVWPRSGTPALGLSGRTRQAADARLSSCAGLGRRSSGVARSHGALGQWFFRSSCIPKNQSQTRKMQSARRSMPNIFQRRTKRLNTSVRASATLIWSTRPSELPASPLKR